MFKLWYVEAAVKATVIAVIFHGLCVLTVVHPIPVGCWTVGVGVFLWETLKHYWNKV